MLTHLPYQRYAETRSISAENPTGARAGGARSSPEPDGPARHLGKGWKTRPCISLKPGETTSLAEIKGPGTIQHIWITVDPVAYRSCVLRYYWDDHADPAVEVPLGDFFANGHALRAPVNSVPVAVNSSGGFNSYWSMPFRKSARIEIENQHWETIDGFFYQITYALEPVDDSAMYFCAQWRRAVTERDNPDYTIVDGLRGRGMYVGTYLAWTQLSAGWWGEGEIKFYIDGDREYPTICGTGTEDYAGGAWCFPEGTYSTPFLGYPLHYTGGDIIKHGIYRWHIYDPIHFAKDLRVTIQALGWWPDQTFQPLADDIASVAYWYQDGNPTRFPELPGLKGRLPR